MGIERIGALEFVPVVFLGRIGGRSRSISTSRISVHPCSVRRSQFAEGPGTVAFAVAVPFRLCAALIVFRQSPCRLPQPYTAKIEGGHRDVRPVRRRCATLMVSSTATWLVSDMAANHW